MGRFVVRGHGIRAQRLKLSPRQATMMRKGGYSLKRSK